MTDGPVAKFRVICDKVPVMADRTCNPGKYNECERCPLATVYSPTMQEGECALDPGSAVETLFLQGSMVESDTTPEQIADYIKQAMEQNPLEIRIRLGSPLEITRLVDLQDENSAQNAGEGVQEPPESTNGQQVRGSGPKDV